jgi:hypothetical protein
VPSPPQVERHVASLLHSPRASYPSGCNAHLPGDCGSAHDLHVPSQALSQQTPSTQKPLAHSLAVVHACASPFATGFSLGSVAATVGVESAMLVSVALSLTEPVSTIPLSAIAVSGVPVSGAPVSIAPVSARPVSAAPVSVSPVSVPASPVVAHEVASAHANGAQECGAPATHAPLPLQLLLVSTAPEQVAPQVTELEAKTQPSRFEPSHTPPQREPSLTHAARPAFGAPLTATHVPGEPDSLHDSH